VERDIMGYASACTLSCAALCMKCFVTQSTVHHLIGRMLSMASFQAQLGECL
jgi:hypothetical protein